MIVEDAIQNFTKGKNENRIYVSPNIPVKKLSNARAKFISGVDPEPGLLTSNIAAMVAPRKASNEISRWLRPLVKVL
jgi:hypothetical protein